MKKLMAIVLAVLCVLVIVGCSHQPQQVKGNLLLSEGHVINVDLSSPKDTIIYLVEKTQKQSLTIGRSRLS